MAAFTLFKVVAPPLRRQKRRRLPCRSIVAVALLAIFDSLLFVSLRLSLWKQVTTIEKAVEYVEVTSGKENVKRYTARRKSLGDPISIRSWMEIVSSDSSVGIQAARDLSDIIASSPYDSVLFETPGTTWKSSIGNQFEFVIEDKPRLRLAENNPDRNAFAEHFRVCLGNNEEVTVCSFPNHRGDAVLVSPIPQTGVVDSSYSHLSAFVRNAPKRQVAEFLRLSASRFFDLLKQNHDEMDAKEAKTWFPTHGTGVSWLHLRLDSRPKYYSYRPFK